MDMMDSEYNRWQETGNPASQQLRHIEASIMLITGVIGVSLNSLVIISLWGRNTENSGYLKIIMVKAMANNIICFGYIIWPVPVTYLDSYFLPQYFNTFMGQFLGWFAWTLGPLTQLLMNGNRVMAVFYPSYFSREFRFNTTNIMLTLCFCFSGFLFSIGMIFDGCQYMFQRTLIGWIHMDSDCGNNLARACVISMFLIIIVSNCFNFSIFIKLAAFSKTLSDVQASIRRRKHRIMLIQSVCQDLLIVLDTFDTTITSRKYPITQFLTMSLSMVFFRMLEGFIFLTMNERIREEAKRVIGTRFIHSKSTPNTSRISTNPLTLFVKSARTSKEFRIIGGTVLIVICIFCLFSNSLVFLSLWKPITSIGGFAKICLVKSWANLIVSIGTLMWPVPCILLNKYFLPLFYDVVFGQILGWFACTLAPLTQILLTSNRAFAVYFPQYFNKKYNYNPTNIGIIVSILLSLSFSIAGFRDGCHFLYLLDRLGWAPEESPCAQILSRFFLIFVFSMAVISNSFNIAVLWKLISDSAQIRVSNNETKRRKSNRRAMFIQSVLQDCLNLFHMLNTTMTFKVYDADWFRFACLSCSIVFVRMLEGIVMLFLNVQIRDGALKLLRLKRIIYKKNMAFYPPNSARL